MQVFWKFDEIRGEASSKKDRTSSFRCFFFKIWRFFDVKECFLFKF